jgi:hypothetical protein
VKELAKLSWQHVLQLTLHLACLDAVVRLSENVSASTSTFPVDGNANLEVSIDAFMMMAV